MMSDERAEASRRDPWFEGILGFAWMFSAALLVFGSGAVVLIALGTHLVIRLRPSTTRVVNYDPSTVGSIALIPVVLGLWMAGMYLRRFRRTGRDVD